MGVLRMRVRSLRFGEFFFAYLCIVRGIRGWVEKLEFMMGCQFMMYGIWLCIAEFFSSFGRKLLFSAFVCVC